MALINIFQEDHDQKHKNVTLWNFEDLFHTSKKFECREMLLIVQHGPMSFQH
jgi:hypothetical protein